MVCYHVIAVPLCIFTHHYTLDDDSEHPMTISFFLLLNVFPYIKLHIIVLYFTEEETDAKNSEILPENSP